MNKAISGGRRMKIRCKVSEASELKVMVVLMENEPKYMPIVPKARSGA